MKKLFTILISVLLLSSLTVSVIPEASSAPPVLADQQVIFNDNGVLTGNANLLFDKNTNQLSSGRFSYPLNTLLAGNSAPTQFLDASGQWGFSFSDFSALSGSQQHDQFGLFMRLLKVLNIAVTDNPNVNGVDFSINGTDGLITLRLIGTQNNGFSMRASNTPGAQGLVLLQNTSNTSFDALVLGLPNTSFPRLKRSAAGLQVRLGDDSGYSFIDSSELRVNGTKVLGSQGTAVADADSSTIVAQFNALLTQLRAHGLISN